MILCRAENFPCGIFFLHFLHMYAIMRFDMKKAKNGLSGI